jgi:hypothetical protein
MINLFEKTRKSFDFLVGKMPAMDLDVQPRSKSLFAQCKFAIVRGHGLDEAAARQVRHLPLIVGTY